MQGAKRQETPGSRGSVLGTIGQLEDNVPLDVGAALGDDLVADDLPSFSEYTAEYAVVPAC